MKLHIGLLVGLLFGIPAIAQTGPAISTTGYRDPSLIELAPGQILTLFLNGVKSTPEGIATSLPLPTSLDGMSVTLIDLHADPRPVPLLRVTTIDNGCPQNRQSDVCRIVALTIQAPYGIEGGSIGPGISGINQLVVSENGVPGPRYGFFSRLSQIHIDRGSFPLGYESTFSNEDHSGSFILHANFRKITATDPAQPGETAVVLA